MSTRRGSAFIMWSVTFAIVFAALGFYRLYFKRVLVNKMTQTSNYMLWNSYGQEPGTYTANSNVASKTIAHTQSELSQHENRAQPVENTATYSVTESTGHSSVAEGADPLLKTFDLNKPIK